MENKKLDENCNILKRWNYHLNEDDGHANPSKDDRNAYHEETLPNLCLITHGLVVQDLCVAKFKKHARGQKRTST
jgi:hypothetical protein